MKNVIYKYEIRITGITQVTLPIGAKVLSAKAQEGRVVIYVYQDLDLPLSIPVRCFRCMPSGIIYPNSAVDSATFIDTVMLLGGALVYHVYEV